MGMKKKNLITVLSCYLLWGTFPAYWNLLIGVNPLFILCSRIVFALLFTISVLIISGRMEILRSTLRNKVAMRYLIPASVMITCNWGIYVWAVNTGRILDVSLGYYKNPLIAFLLGVVVFREKYTRLQLVAVALAFTGLLISIIAFGSVPYTSIFIALAFAAYGVFKKKARTDPVASIAAETLITAPFALVFAFVFMTDSISAANTSILMLLIGGGAVTAIPLILFTRAINNIPLIVVGFFQYISPSLVLIYGLLSGETISASQLVSFIFIGLGLIVFSIALIRISKKEDTALALPYIGKKQHDYA